MSVIISKHEPGGEAGMVGDKCACSVCGRKPLHYPFLWWMGETDIYICSTCCTNIKAGLMADLIHITAIVAMQEVNPAYAQYTLRRMSLEDVKRDKERVDRELDAIDREMGLGKHKRAGNGHADDEAA
jgi:hypothetical protein